jgi:hypothetical protein
MKRNILTALILLSVQFTFAQDFFDALRYSQTEYGGTARSIAMGSAFGALGSDFVSASINPAGMGLYRNGEFTLSPTLNLNQVESSYLGNSRLDDKYNFNFNNLSYVSTIKTGVESGIVSVTFGLGYNRLKNFNSNQIIQGQNAKTTLLSYFTDYANQAMDQNSFNYHYEGMAWNTWLIDKDENAIEGVYYNDLTDYTEYEVKDANGNYIGPGYSANDIFSNTQKSIVNKAGRIDEYAFSTGINFNHKFFWGATLGLNDLEYIQNVTYSETVDKDQINKLKDFSLETNTHDSGFGVNLKTGFIFRPIKPLRIGLALHTPTFYSISRSEDKKLNANFEKEVGNSETGMSKTYTDQNDIYYNYKLETPVKAIVSAAYSLGEKAILSADYEWVNYSTSKFRSAANDHYDYSDHNADINKLLNSTSNIRVGGEYRVTPNISLRAGYNFIGNPWKSSYTFEDGVNLPIANKDDSFGSYSAGFGYRQESFFVDIAFRMNQYNYTQKVHEISTTNPTNGSALASMKEINNQATITFGFRF